MEKTRYIENRTDDIEDRLDSFIKNVKNNANITTNLQTELNNVKTTQTQHSTTLGQHSTAISDHEQRIGTNEQNITSIQSSKQDKLTFDELPTENSSNPVKSGGVYSALAGKQSTLTTAQQNAVDSGITSTEVLKIATNASNIASLQSGKQNLITTNSKLSSDLVDDTSATNKFVTSSEKITWNNKQNALTFDNVPTSGSTNPITSGGVFTTLASKGGVYRGTFNNWNAVPSSVDGYEQDNGGSKTPLKNDFIILNDSSGKLDDSAFLYLSNTTGARASLSVTYNGVTSTIVYYNATGESNAVVLNGIVNVYYNSNTGKWVVKTLRSCTFNNVNYSTNDVIAQWGYSSYQEQYIHYTSNTNGSLFIYDGVWKTDGKNGWNVVASVNSMSSGIITELNAKQDILTFDTTPTSSSSNPVTSGGVYTALSSKQPSITSSNKLSADLVDDGSTTNKFVTSTEKSTWNNKQSALTFDTTPTSSSTNPVTSGGVYTALSNKQNILTFDSSPTQDGTNPVTSGGVYSALNGKEETSNKITTVSSTSTDTEYPSAKAVYNRYKQNLDNISSLNTRLTTAEGNISSVQTQANTTQSSLNTTNSNVSALQTTMQTKESTSNKVTSISSGSTDVEYPTAKCVYDAIQQLNSHGIQIEMRSINKFGLANTGDASVVANRELTVNICTVKAPAGSKVYVLNFLKHRNYKSQSTTSGLATFGLLINGQTKCEMTNTKATCGIGELLGCEFTATGGYDQISVHLYSASSSSLVSFASTFCVVIGENIEVSQTSS